MASKENKIVRRAQALSDLSRLSGQLAEKFNLELPDASLTSKDKELAEIQRIEGINAMLEQVLQAGDGGVKPFSATLVDDLTKAELIEKATELNIEVSKLATKADIIAAIEQHGAKQ